MCTFDMYVVSYPNITTYTEDFTRKTSRLAHLSRMGEIVEECKGTFSILCMHFFIAYQFKPELHSKIRSYKGGGGGGVSSRVQEQKFCVSRVSKQIFMFSCFSKVEVVQNVKNVMLVPFCNLNSLVPRLYFSKLTSVYEPYEKCCAAIS